jgi:hypothetical protein
MKTAWICIWVSFAAAEIGLTFCLHSTTFLAIGAVAPVMVAFNLLRLHRGGRGAAQVPVEVAQPTPVAG